MPPTKRTSRRWNSTSSLPRVAPPIGDGCSGLKSRGLPFSCSVTAGGETGESGRAERGSSRLRCQPAQPTGRSTRASPGGLRPWRPRRSDQTQAAPRPVGRSSVGCSPVAAIVQPEPNRPGRGVGRKRASPPISRLKVSDLRRVGYLFLNVSTSLSTRAVTETTNGRWGHPGHPSGRPDDTTGRPPARRRARVRPEACGSAAQRSTAGRTQSMQRPRPRLTTGRSVSECRPL